MIDLREVVPTSTRRALEVMGLAEEFSVLTAFNPRGVDIPDEENSKRMKELEAELTSSGDEFVRVDACAPDRSHCECSVAIKGSRARAIDMARRWEQIAVFWWDGGRFWIYGAISNAEAIQLPLDDSDENKPGVR